MAAVLLVLKVERMDAIVAGGSGKFSDPWESINSIDCGE